MRLKKACYSALRTRFSLLSMRVSGCRQLPLQRESMRVFAKDFRDTQSDLEGNGFDDACKHTTCMFTGYSRPTEH